MEETGFRGTINKLDCPVKREKRSRDNSSTNDDQDDSKQGIFSLKDNKLELAKAEMGEVKEENQRLKKHLSQIIEEYKNLHKKFRDAADHNQQEIELQGNESATTVTTTTHHQEHDHLVSLRLGRNAPASTSYQKNENENLRNKSNPNYEDEDDKEGLALGLDCKFESPTIVSSADNSVEEMMKEEKWPPGKALKKDDHEAPQQNPAAKKTRVSVRARCDTPTMNDGCQWRKYGQKISKGNPCPRAYYRCTVSTTCPVRKQVQRCAQDMSILITTYEGTHNHPLSMSATAMASTTSAAASMLISGSSTSGSSNPNNPSSSTTTPAELHGLNFYLSDGSKPNPFYPQNPNSPSCPTITLDLTSNTISSSPLINRSTSSNLILPRYSTTNLNFGSWNNMNGALTYAPNSQSYINNYQSLNFGRHPPHQENIYQPYMQNNNMQQSLQANTIEAATNAITSDPNFQSALQAVLSSIINSSATTGPSGSGNGGGDSGSGQNSKLTEALFPVLSSFVPSTSNANNLLKKSSSPTENLMFPPPPYSSSSFSASKSKSTSSDDSRDHVN